MASFVGRLFRERTGRKATGLAFAVALIWLIHPLQTESVTNIVQRAESLAGFLYLLTLYLAVRAFTGQRPYLWYAGSSLACCFGMLSKEIMVSAPLMVLMYDILFVSGSYREALKNRPGYYVALAVTWIPLVALVFLVGTHGGTVGTGLGMSSVQYAATQFGVISKYLTLSFWPSPLIVDYESEVARGAAQIIPYAFIVISLVIGTAYAIRNVSWLGFLGFWFFAILAPTSSVLPVVSQTMAEHRMYLPLAAVTALVVICGESLCHRLLTLFAIPVEDRRFLSRWVPIFILAIVAWALLSLTIARNRDYSSELVLWRDTIEKRPTNSRAHSNYGVALIESGKIDLAFEQFTKALELDPKNADAVTNIGGILASQGRGSEAIPFLEDGLRYRPKNAGAHTNLGSVLAALGRFDEAIEHYRASLKIDPLHAETHNNLGNALLRNGKIDDAISELRRARELKPDSDQIRLNLQTALDQKLKSE